MTELSPERARQAIVDHTHRLAGAATAAGPGTPVPTAPEWTVTDLVAHVGQTHHWVADMIERRITDPAELPTEMAGVPTDPGEWPAWLSRSAERVATACALDVPVFNAAGDERSGTQFWRSTVLNETVVHGADAANAAGRRLDVASDIAAALITNHLAMLTSPTWEMRRPESAHALRGTGQTLQWQASDVEAGWFIERLPAGATWHPATRPADVTVTGPAGSLLLIMTRRLPLTHATDVDLDGDTALAQHWLDNTAHVAD
ncbi:maleylpyruvate isomerase family mycothiol-dependent enzyme [Paractinoplanes atraurantiacus]|uniref:TIGR03083 family protein n=1 Tax=Paractinoplanes atraurantiacus TaxID=1036182 RepID=A0A285HYM5_9ACTN|nr:maleylpyruvate isomerase family mycothiol-dependent enzyme [Actinoplanes atraurantiacus]SNY40825.1 TIGR03083 family protein [Actinoplanes atraurantiacus]